jgi:hypothetical protein
MSNQHEVAIAQVHAEPQHFGTLPDADEAAPLSAVPSTTLQELENVIHHALAKQRVVFMAIGAALAEIRDRNLYGDSFEICVKSRFGFSRSTAL